MLKAELGTKDFWTLGEIDQLMQDKFGITYSQRHLRTILKKMGVFHYKPEPLDYRRSDNSEQELTDKLLATTDALQVLGLKIDEVALDLPMRPVHKQIQIRLECGQFITKPEK
ncbi:MAG: winged helix-turn-helix domain-containing protein [Spirosomataceae bacterium]